MWLGAAHRLIWEMGGTVTRPNYNFVDATFHFFKVFGQRPLSVLWLMLWQTLTYAGLIALILRSSVLVMLMQAVDTKFSRNDKGKYGPNPLNIDGRGRVSTS